MFDLLLRIFIRDYQNVKDPAVRERYGVFSGVVGIILNLLLTGGKLCAGVITGAVSVTADAFNNLSDAASSLATLLGFRMAGRKADENHPYGHGRIEYLTGLAVSVLILFVGLELGRQSFVQIFHPEPVEFSLLSIGILAASVLVKLWIWAFDRSLGQRIQSAAILAASADAISDCAATGAVLFGLVAYQATGISIDGWVGLIVSLFILRAGWESARDTITPLLGQAPDRDLVEKIRETVLTHPEVSGVHDLIVHDYGPGNTMVTLHAEVAADASLRQIHEVIDRIERELEEKFRVKATIHMDPVATDDPVTLAMEEKLLSMARELHPGITLHDFRVTAGPDHMNLIFDLLVPRSCKLTDDEISGEMARKVSEADARYVAVIQVDHPYETEERNETRQ